MSRLLDPKDKSGKFPFEYTRALDTNVRKTWERFGYAAPQVTPERQPDKSLGVGTAVAAPLRIIAKRPK